MTYHDINTSIFLQVLYYSSVPLQNRNFAVSNTYNQSIAAASWPEYTKPPCTQSTKQKDNEYLPPLSAFESQTFATSSLSPSTSFTTSPSLYPTHTSTSDAGLHRPSSDCPLLQQQLRTQNEHQSNNPSHGTTLFCHHPKNLPTHPARPILHPEDANESLSPLPANLPTHPTPPLLNPTDTNLPAPSRALLPRTHLFHTNPRANDPGLGFHLVFLDRYLLFCRQATEYCVRYDCCDGGFAGGLRFVGGILSS